MAYIPRKKPATHSSFKKKEFTRAVSSSRVRHENKTPRTGRSSSSTTRTARPYSEANTRVSTPIVRSYPPRRGASAPFRGKTPVSSPKNAPDGIFPQKPPYRPGQSFSHEKRQPASPRPLSKPSFKSPSRPATPKPPRTVSASFKPKTPTTSWGEVADWYDAHLSKGDTYHEKVILPNLLRLVDPKRGDSIVDLACGTGYFTQALAKEGATLTGIDIGEELIAIARKASPAISYHVSSAEKVALIDDSTKDKVVMVLAIQNIERPVNVFAEALRMLKSGGAFHIVMNHPAFRIPKHSSWEYDDKKKVQFRRIEEYMSESTGMIEMHPGMKETPTTISFHRPLQYYFKAFVKAGFVVDRLEEWISHKSSDSGPRAKAENVARKEIPLFLYMSARKK